MMGAFEIDALCRLLERQEIIATSRQGAGAIPAAAAFIRFVRSEPPLASLADELEAEAQGIRQAQNESCAGLLISIKAMHTTYAGALAERGVDLTFADDAFCESLLRDLRESRDLRAARRAFQKVEAVLEELRDALRDLFEMRAAEDDAELRASAAELRRLDRLYRRLSLQVRAAGETLPGEAYAALRDYSDTLVPRIFQNQQGQPEVFEPHLEQAERIWTKVEQAKALGRDALDPIDEEVHRLVHRVSIGLQAGLTHRVSQEGLIRRFAARCESFEAAQIRQRAEQSKGKVEAELTIEFALYLFDAGYDPIINPEISGLKPDLLDAGGAPGLYVEVKQSKELTSTYLRGAVAQVLDTWQRLATRFELPESILLVFRLGGAPVQVPSELITPQGRLLIRVVNLAPTSISGSRAEKPVRLSPEDLL